MGREIHYAVCTRCGMILRGSSDALAKHRVARGSRGDLVIRAHHHFGCSGCGHDEVEVRWGVPSPVAPRNASFAARRTFD